MNDSATIDTWEQGYLEAVYTLARCRHEAINSELTEPYRYARYADRYTFGLDMVKTLTRKSYVEIDRDINWFIIRLTAMQQEKEGNYEQAYQAQNQAHYRRGVR